MNIKAPSPGSTFARAIVVVCGRPDEGIGVEYAHLHRMFGRRWRLLRQSLVRDGERSYDVLEVTVGRRRETVHFDITSFIPPMPARAKELR